jgi:hypothetical protein
MNAIAKGRSVGELLRSASASRISTFLNCKLKFYFQYVAGLSSEKSGARLIGSGVHEVLRKWKKQVITTDALKHELGRFFDGTGVKWQPGAPIRICSSSTCDLVRWRIRQCDQFLELKPVDGAQLFRDRSRRFRHATRIVLLRLRCATEFSWLVDFNFGRPTNPTHNEQADHQGHDCADHQPKQ